MNENSPICFVASNFSDYVSSGKVKTFKEYGIEFIFGKRKFKTTYIEIDQVPKQHAVILNKPSWIWGAEMGVNDAGVVIGNEALFSKVIEHENGLLCMDLLRLGLERGDNAQHAMQVIIELLQKHEPMHRKLLFLPEKRKSYIERLDKIEAKMMSVFEKPYHEITKEDFVKADNKVMKFEEQEISKFKTQAFNYSLFSPYNWFWKRMNRLDGF